MPNVRGGENMLGALNIRRRPGTLPPVAQMNYDSVAYLRAGITSDDGRSTIAGITNFATGSRQARMGFGRAGPGRLPGAHRVPRPARTNGRYAAGTTPPAPSTGQAHEPPLACGRQGNMR